MYQDDCKQVERPRHQEIAQKMAMEVCENFDPNQQNEIALIFVDFIKKRRSVKIAELREESKFLEESLIKLEGGLK